MGKQIGAAVTKMQVQRRSAIYRLFSNVKIGANQLIISCLRLLRGTRGIPYFRSFRSLRDDNRQGVRMPQTMNVLCCFSCSMYQVHIVKKSNKWQCKICGTKQSIQVVYFQGSGSECREQVQHLNLLRAKQENRESFRSASIDAYGLDCVTDESDAVEPCDCHSRTKHSAGKWAKFLDTDNEEESSSESSVEKENLSLSEENSQRRRKQILKRKNQSHSLPATQSCSNAQSNSQKNCFESAAKASRSSTYPLVNNTKKICGKWDRFLNNEQETCSSEATSSQNETLAEDSATSISPSKRCVFENSNDDLDIDIDF